MSVELCPDSWVTALPSAEFGRFHSRPPLELFAFDFGSRWSVALRAMGVTSATSAVCVGDGLLDVQFGRWKVRTPLENVAGVELTGPYAPWRVLGARLSWDDHAVTFGSSPRAGLCVRLHRPVPGIDPFGVVVHPAVTVTVAEPEALAMALPGVHHRMRDNDLAR